MADSGATSSDELDTLYQAGIAHLERGAVADALPLLTAVAGARPDAGILNDLGTALAMLGRIDESIERFQSALALDPRCLAAYANLGKVLLERGRAAEALPLLRHGLTLGPDFAPLHEQLVCALLEHGNHHLVLDGAPLAEASYREAIAMRPHFAAAITNLATALVAQNRLPEAIATYRASLALQPGNANTEFALSLALLLFGEFTEGWQRFEARYAVTTMARNYQRRFEVPRCPPQQLLSLPRGSKVLLLKEQGAGDMIQHVRYASLLIDRGLRVTLEAPPELHSLFHGIPGAAVIGPDEAATDVDAGGFLLSLPVAFGTELSNIPHRVPYLHAAPDRVARWSVWLDKSRRRIGLAVSGDPAHPHDAHRSIPLARFAPLFALPASRFILVQRDVRLSDTTAIAQHGLLAPGGELRDFADTAALLSQLDLLITVDTSVAHLAGALGIPVWLMLRFSPDYRWLLDRDDSPWYPTMRLYRQPAPGDWDTVIDAVATDLRAFR
jgi:Flp pilus assembly protein TadD